MADFKKPLDTDVFESMSLFVVTIWLPSKYISIF